MEVAVDPADLVLPRRPVAGDGMDMAVDQARRDGGAVGIDDRGGALGVDVLESANGRYLAVLGHDRVAVQDRLLQGPRQQQPDIADHQLARSGCLGRVVGHGFPFGSMLSPDILPGLTIRSSGIIHSYTNDRIRMIVYK